MTILSSSLGLSIKKEKNIQFWFLDWQLSFSVIFQNETIAKDNHFLYFNFRNDYLCSDFHFGKTYVHNIILKPFDYTKTLKLNHFFLFSGIDLAWRIIIFTAKCANYNLIWELSLYVYKSVRLAPLTVVHCQLLLV